jgi:hypothetical protein
MIDEFKKAGVNPKDVFAQSFNKSDILYWVRHEPQFGRQAVYLDDIDPTVSPPLPRISLDELRELRRAGVRIIASFERADLRKGAGPAGFYYLFDPDSRAVKKTATCTRQRSSGGPHGRVPATRRVSNPLTQPLFPGIPCRAMRLCSRCRLRLSQPRSRGWAL